MNKAMIGVLICMILLMCKTWVEAGELAKQPDTQITDIQIIESTIEYKIEYKPSKGEEIGDIIFDVATMTVKEAKVLGVKGLEKKNLKDIIEVKYPKVVVLGKRVKYTEKYEKLIPTSIKFLDEEGNLKKEILLEKIIPKGWGIVVNFSKNKKYIGITGKFARYKGKKPSEAKFIMINADGEILWKTNISKVGSPFGISPNGKYIVCVGDITGDYFDYMPSIWNANGLVKTLCDFEKEYYEVYDLDFSKDGTWFAISISDHWNVQIKSLTPTCLIVFDDKGNELWRKENKNGGLVSISSKDHVYLFTTDYERDEFKVHIFDKEGNLLEIKDGVKKEYAKLLYIKNNVKLYGIEEKFYKNLQLYIKENLKLYGIEYDIEKEFYENLQKK